MQFYLPDFCSNTLCKTARTSLAVAQLLKLLPSYDKRKKVSVKQALQQERKHAAHCTMPLGLHKSMLFHIIAVMHWKIQIVVPGSKGEIISTTFNTGNDRSCLNCFLANIVGMQGYPEDIPRTRQANGLDLLQSATEAASPFVAHQAAEKVGTPLSKN